MVNRTNNYKEQLRPLLNAHPGLDLARVFERFTALNAAAGGTKRFSRRELVSKLGFTKSSGAANTIISAMVHFGLLQKTNTDYVYSALAKNMLNAPRESETYYTLLREAAFSPELYKWLKDEYGTKLPDGAADKLVRKYRHRNINSRNVRQVINNYKKTLSYAKVEGPRNTTVSQSNDLESKSDEYVNIALGGGTVSVYKRYLLEAIRMTREDEIKKIDESLSQESAKVSIGG